MNDRIKEAVRQICEWNEARFKPELNPEFNLRLWQEEWDELRESIHQRDISNALRELADIVFVCVGNFWRGAQGNTDLTVEEFAQSVEQAEDTYQSTRIELYCPIPAYLVAYQYEAYPHYNLFCAVRAFREMCGWIGNEAALQVLELVIKANNRKPKPEQPVSPGQKIPKGEGFEFPVDELEAIVNAALSSETDGN